MSEYSVLVSLINDVAVIPVQDDGYGNKTLELTEVDAPDSSVEIRHVPNDLIAIDVDRNFSNDGLVSSSRGARKRCDYLLLSAQMQCAVSLEMKRENPSTQTEQIQQLTGTLCVFEYFDALLRNFYKEDFLGQYARRFAVLRHTRIRRRGTRSQSPVLHDAPERALFLCGQTVLQFGQLARPNA
ncbi:hypothetical protein FHS27_000673 [Rhodopirellula rubra]|uniref:Uncharacterized protein n=1 Tax=Aporhodopirellula rubra TaxID=980271 RepID=A0A7W5H4J8_9BACT|nr:hypothetical protein [Aporhodopirellula rubra]MBB3204906.1 hypothetical protein [Aporhodopirellula rubra]